MPPKKSAAAKGKKKGAAKKKPEPEPSPHSSGEDSGRSPTPPPVEDVETSDVGQKKKRARTEPVVLSEEQELDMCDWLKTNSFLYTKGEKLFKDTNKKLRTWSVKGAEFGLTGPALKTWYLSIRTKLGKLTIDKSGAAVRDNTDREKFFLDQFGFLKAHITRVASRTPVSVSINHIKIYHVYYCTDCSKVTFV